MAPIIPEYFNDAVVNERHNFTLKNQHLADQFSHWTPDENNNGTTELYRDFTPFEVSDGEFDYVTSPLFTSAQASPNYEELGIPVEESTNNFVDSLLQLDDIQPSVQDLVPSLLDFEFLDQYSSSINQDSPKSIISDFQKPRTSNRIKCQCPNCSVAGGNKTIGPNGKPQHICHYPDCGKIYSATWHLKKHITLVHSDEKKQCQCPNCSVEGGNKTIGSNGKLQHICHYPGCGKIYNATHHLKKHIALVHSNEKNFFCVYCDKGFPYKYMMKRHIKTHIYDLQNKFKNNTVEPFVSSSSTTPKVRLPRRWKNRTICHCSNCSAEGGNKTKGPHGRQQHICDIPDCGRVFDYMHNLRRHLIMNHSGTKNFFCAHCNKGFTYKCMMKKHVERHMNIRTKGFNYDNTVNQVSENLSTPELQMPQKLIKTRCQCPNCSAEGGNKTKGPNGKLQHVCHYLDCGKVYGETWHLKKHLESHTKNISAHCKNKLRSNPKNSNVGSKVSRKRKAKKIRKQQYKKSKCLNCSANDVKETTDSKDKLDNAKDNLDCVENSNKHLNSKTVKKIFACDYCQKKFYRKDYLRTHVERHLKGMTLTKCQCRNCNAEGGNKIKGSNGKLQHPCHYPNCGKVYSETWHLKKHIAMRHSREKKFFCVYCNEGFAFKYMMKNHVERHIKSINDKFGSQVPESLSIFKLQRPDNLSRAKCKCPNCSVEGGNKTKGPKGKLQHACHFPDCGKVYGETWHLKRHIALMHSGTNNYLSLHIQAPKSSKRKRKC